MTNDPISRDQLLKELLPGLNALFGGEHEPKPYGRWGFCILLRHPIEFIHTLWINTFQKPPVGLIKTLIRTMHQRHHPGVYHPGIHYRKPDDATDSKTTDE